MFWAGSACWSLRPLLVERGGKRAPQQNFLSGVSRMSTLFAASSRVQNMLCLVTDLTSGLAQVLSLVHIDVYCECYYYGLLLRCVWCVYSFLLLLWILFSHTAAAQLLANSCSPLRFAWTTGRRSARGISVRLASCSRSPALADLTTLVCVCSS